MNIRSTLSLIGLLLVAVLFLPLSAVRAETICLCFDVSGDCSEIPSTDSATCYTSCEQTIGSMIFQEAQYYNESDNPTDYNNAQALGCATQADSASSTGTPLREWIAPKLSVKIPGVSFSQPIADNGNVTINFLGEYISGIYKFMIGTAGLIAIVMVMIGGLQYVLASGGQSAGKAKERISKALTGLVLVFAAFLILYTVNPALTVFNGLELRVIQQRIEPFARPSIIANPALSTEEQRYKNMSCPETSELNSGVTFFATAYYKPTWGEKGGYQNFECNIGMNCSCPEPPGREEEETCESSVGDWPPCKEFDENTPYCNKTSAETEPVAFKSVATSKCIPRGTYFRVLSSGNSEAESAIWRSDDSGSWIQGRRVDLFVGTGQSALQDAKGIGGEVTIKFCTNNDPNNC